MDAQQTTLLSIYTGLVGYVLLTQRAAPLNLTEAREAAERDTVTRALAHGQSSLAKASRLLGISRLRPTLYKLLKKFQLDGRAGSQGTAD